MVDDAAREQMVKDVKELIEKGDLADALATAEKGLEQFQAAGDVSGQATALYMQSLANSKLNDDDPGAALVMAQSALSAVKDAGDKEEIASATLMVGELHFANGELDEATKVARDSAALYQELGDQSGAANCSLLVSDLHLMRQEADEAMEEAVKAYGVFAEVGDIGGKASAKHKQAKAHKMNGQPLEALRAASMASKLWHSVKDIKNEVRANVAEAEAKVAIMQERDDTSPADANIVALAQAAATMAKKFRKSDHVTVGNAHYALALVLVRSNGLKGATQAGREAAKCFRKAGMDHHVARATLVWAEAEFKMNLLEDAQERAQRCLSMFERSTDDDGKMKALNLMDDINYSLGLPTRAELEERQRQIMMQQQQQMMMMQQQQFMMMPQQQQQAPQEEEQASGGGGGQAAFHREGSPLALSAGMDPAIIKSKVAELAGAIIGDSDELEVDTPLMEAGLTSNSAVLLRDELSKDLPGINLPPTLIFDYPSVAAISDFVVEASKKLKK